MYGTHACADGVWVCARGRMDTMGTCDAFCEVVWQGQTVKTSVKKNSYSPDWDEIFAFSFADISAGVTDLEGAFLSRRAVSAY